MRFFSLCLLLTATPVFAQNWRAGISTGPFVFGEFVRRTTRTGTETGSSVSTIRLTAAPRPGIAADVERSFTGHWALRLEGTFTDSKLSVKNKSGGGVSIDAGKLDVTTWVMPVVFNFNRHGAFRVHVFGGPAFATYKIRNGAGTIQEFSGQRGRFGGAAGAGLQWWMNDDFAFEGNIQDIVTASPFERSDFPASTTGLKISKPHNVHTTIGLRYRF